MIRYNLNPIAGVNPDNAAQIARGVCCDGVGTICQWVWASAALGTYTSITLKNRAGTNVTTTVSGVTDRATLRAAYELALEAVGARVYGDGLKITKSGSNYGITALGEVPFVSFENGATRTFTQNCTSAYTCTALLFIPYGVGTAIYNGSSVSLGTVTSATTAISLKTTLDTLTSLVNTVTADVGRSGFIVSVPMPSSASYFINGVGPQTPMNCTPVFTT